ncbi:MAG TPA: hypothetical protein VFH58_10765 [Acidimicrobiales bacterium]|nr:hypothetical protein [Acidimicrobiales bacterium]
MKGYRAVLRAALPALVLAAGCTSGHSTALRVNASFPTTAPIVSSIAPPTSLVATPTTGTPSTVSHPATTLAPSASGGAVQDLAPTQAVLDSLLQAFARAKGISETDVDRPVTGSVHYSLVTGTGTYWATARFSLSTSASAQTADTFLDNGNVAVFSRQGDGAWSVTIGRIPSWPCPSDVPANVLTAWGWSYGQQCVLDSPRPDQLMTLLVTTADVPQGFVDQGAEGGGGSDTSAGRSLANATGRWTRTRTPADEDNISVFLSLFPTAAAADSYNGTYAAEVLSTGPGPVLERTTVAGVPGSVAVLSAGTSGGGPGSAAQPLPPTAAACYAVAGVSVCILVSDHQESPLPIAQQIAAAQYKRIYSAINP